MANPVLQKFATMTITLGDTYTVKGGPVGSRIIAEVATVEVAGDRLNASLVGKAAADWVTPSPVYELYEVRS